MYDAIKFINPKYAYIIVILLLGICYILCMCVCGGGVPYNPCLRLPKILACFLLFWGIFLKISNLIPVKGLDSIF